MADILYPIQELGGTDALRYAVRNVRGVEAPAAAPTDRSGFNEEAEFTGRADRALLTEHTSAGIHTGWKFPCANLLITWNGTAYAVGDESEDRGVRHGDTSIASIVRNAAGDVTITMATALPSTAISVGHVYVDQYDLGSTTFAIVKTSLFSSTTTTLHVYRWEGTAISSLAKTDGDLALAVWSK